MYKDFHQPYENKGNVFACKKNDRFESVAWDLYLNFEIPIKINEYDSICSPVIEGDKISFIAQKWNNPGFDYRLVKGTLNESFTEVINIQIIAEQSKYGFAADELIVKEALNGEGFYVNEEIIEIPYRIGITRIVPAKGLGNCLLVTGSEYLNDFAPVTFVYHLNKKDWIGRLTVEGENVYKCCIAEDGCIYYAEKMGENFEDRMIIKNSSWSIKPIGT
jgi:hypothetical protein